MRFKIGQSLMLLEFKPVDSAEPARPIASATVLSYDNGSKLYKVRYKEYNTEIEGELDIPEERLFSLIG